MRVDQRSSSVTRSIVLALLVFSCAGPPASAAAAGVSSKPPAGARPVLGRGTAPHSLADAGVHFRSLPLRFEPNLGQTDPQVRFLSSTSSGEVFLTPGEMVLRIHQARSGEGRKTENRLAASESA